MTIFVTFRVPVCVSSGPTGQEAIKRIFYNPNDIVNTRALICLIMVITMNVCALRTESDCLNGGHHPSGYTICLNNDFHNALRSYGGYSSILRILAIHSTLSMAQINIGVY